MNTVKCNIFSLVIRNLNANIIYFEHGWIIVMLQKLLLKTLGAFIQWEELRKRLGDGIFANPCPSQFHPVALPYHVALPTTLRPSSLLLNFILVICMPALCLVVLVNTNILFCILLVDSITLCANCLWCFFAGVQV